MLLKDDEVKRWARKFSNDYGDPISQTTSRSKGVEKKKKAAFFKQFCILSARYMTLIKNDAQRLVMVFIQPIVIAMLIRSVGNAGHGASAHRNVPHV